MTLNDPVSKDEKYILKLRLHMERLFGQQIKSVCISGVDFRHPKSDKLFKVDLIRFQNHFHYPLPMKELPYLDLFIDPVDKHPRISVHGEQNYSTLLEEEVPAQEIEHLFGSLIWGTEMTKKGLVIPLLKEKIQ
jgi:hypothetical protein